MRGQMIFEFVVAALLFFAILFYIITFLSSSFSSMSSDVKDDNNNARLAELSGFLVKDGNIDANFIDHVCGSGSIDGIVDFNLTTIYQNGTVKQSCGKQVINIGIKRAGLLDGRPMIVSLAIGD